MKRVNLKRSLLVVSLATLMFTSLAGCVVYDSDPYPRHYDRERYYYRPYYYRDSYSRPYYYRDRYGND
jgi:hypothetical protein